jgi:hypothetical protein
MDDSIPLRQADAGQASRAKALFRAYVAALRSQPNGQTEQQLDAAGWRLATVIGYDFKADIDGWECWYRWATQGDRAVVDVCLASPNPVTRRLGIDIAFASKEERLVRQAVERIAGETNTDMNDAVVDWLVGRGLRHIPSDREHVTVGWDRVLVPSEEQWRRIGAVLDEYSFAADCVPRSSQ